MEEIRAGYMSIDVLLDITTEAIKKTTFEGVYHGNPDWIYKAYALREYLKQ